MKNYKVLIVNIKSGEILLDQNEFSKTKKYLIKKYKLLYYFEKNIRIKITRLIKKPGTQMSILDIINQ